MARPKKTQKAPSSPKRQQTPTRRSNPSNSPFMNFLRHFKSRCERRLAQKAAEKWHQMSTKERKVYETKVTERITNNKQKTMVPGVKRQLKRDYSTE